MGRSVHDNGLAERRFLHGSNISSYPNRLEQMANPPKPIGSATCSPKMRQTADTMRSHAETLISALASACVVAAGFVGLLFGLDLHLSPAAPHSALVAIVPTRDIATPPPSPPPPPPPQRPARKAGGGSPAPEGTKGAPIVAPPAAVILAPTPPFATAAIAGSGGTGTAGTGVGSGGNGSGDGKGSGNGSGPGAGGLNAGVSTYPRQIAGRMNFSDLPLDLRKTRTGAELTVRYRIGVDGAVSGCTVVASSGRPELDAATCAHITSRFRFRPALDAAGRPTAFVMTETQGWNNNAQ